MILSVILAAGEGTRMKSNIPKAAHKVCGKSMVNHVINAARDASCEKNIVIVGHGKEKVISSVEGNDVEFVTQPVGDDMPYGTGYAVMQAKEYISDEDKVLILTGDTPLIEGDTLKELVDYGTNNNLDAIVLTAKFKDSTGYGRIKRNEKGNILGIIEHKDASENELDIKEINSGIFLFSGKALKEALENLTNDNSQNEYYITDTIEILNRKGYNVGGYLLKDNKEISGVNSKVQLAEAEKIMRDKINIEHMLKGVTLINPENTYIEKGVIIGRDTIIYPGAIIKGSTKIGDNCIIEGNSDIKDCIIGDRVNIKSSTLIESKVDDDTKVGPNAYLRPNSVIGKSVKIGDFVEVKNSKIGNGSKASHLSYIGDAEIGENVNIGCGVVFVNYDGEKKHRTIVGDNAFIGSNSNLVAPVIIRDNGYIAAGSTITHEVKEGDLSIGRARQINKPGWVFRKNNK
ncbi:bifunctional UDP-N-acetylglucosamine diphosphorylase/glucosamine-1-phosphate N-acetyltransferase GlmU [Clostridium sp. D2Q-14]|uniref:bifunctional UDP-N-acetylglucosamine diphosphorylase/glucosamine-1-phosphate N-acetyltransferase GlmU n=1 Tax=Anaeromonas gelatinilytica TaxID=2683194 RepID=UPI00193C53CD|nr:bifunctional UDP-N-acetylglucosamine diphosphorylase/glucosamine-1-phosphate N-acetyltransferase GlmU [Anaeromonas gelatinilytica]MBS4534678.1 bifunctional UDP-N-acetylglucosamine diphosphorylase/glucosamine-1-phosphate N-acetyltransferase GlmU [Anaeromonas gelatinilytica]